MANGIIAFHPGPNDQVILARRLSLRGRPRQFIPLARRLSAAPPHDPVESLKIRPRLPVREKTRSLQRRSLLRYRHGDELIDTGTILPASAQRPLCPLDAEARRRLESNHCVLRVFLRASASSVVRPRRKPLTLPLPAPPSAPPGRLPAGFPRGLRASCASCPPSASPAVCACG